MWTTSISSATGGCPFGTKGLKQPEVDAIVGEARQLLDLDRIFWRSPKAAFAMFAAPGYSHVEKIQRTVPELVVVIGRRAKNVSVADAPQYIFGITAGKKAVPDADRLGDLLIDAMAELKAAAEKLTEGKREKAG